MQVSPHDIGSKMQVLARQRGHLTSLAGIALALVLACALCLVAPGTAHAAINGNDYVGQSTVNDRGMNITEAPAIESPYGILVDEDGNVLWARGQDEHRAMASITKTMTAIVALENGDLDEVFTVSPRAASVGESSAGLVAGQQVTLRDLVSGLLVHSGNDASMAIAEGIAGGEKEFVQMMNAKAQQMGLVNTQFQNPHGLDAENHYSSAADISVIVRYAMQDPTFREIVGMKSCTLNLSGEPKELLTTNALLATWDDCIGVKTGFTKKAGRCLVSAAEKDGVRLICVTLNCPDDWNTHAALYQRYFALTESRPLTLEAPILPVVGGQKAALQTVLVGQPTYTAIRGREEGITVTVYLNRGFCYAPVEAGQPLGQVVWRRGDHVIGTAVLATGESIPALESHRPWWQKLYG